MRLIYTRDGFSKKEKEQWRIVIFQNIIDGLRMIVDTMEKSNIPFQYENTAVSLSIATKSNGRICIHH
jgi:guanine nucleotide-binding protein subunit alpha